MIFMYDQGKNRYKLCGGFRPPARFKQAKAKNRASDPQFLCGVTQKANQLVFTEDR
jgi:hypothetical protein